MKVVLSKFRRPRPRQSEPSRESGPGNLGAVELYIPVPTNLKPHFCGEGELLKKRTERGEVAASGINSRKPHATDWLRRSWAAYRLREQMRVGGRGPIALNFTSDHRVLR